MNKVVIKQKIEEVLDYLISQQETGNFFAKNNYGETFTFLTLYKTSKEKYGIHINNLLEVYDKRDKSHFNFHWEFNNYALACFLEEQQSNIAYNNLYPLKFKGTECTNWTLLRCLTRYIVGEKDKAIRTAKNKILKFQKSSGLILDEYGVKSLQYHCFSMALIGEFYERTKDNFFKESFIKSLEFIANFILSNGMSIYIGRGQEQLFGYGPLLYSLELGFKITKDERYKGYSERIFQYVFSYQRKSGSLPLVLREEEIDYPTETNVNDPNYLGWYNYNNYFDYLPFFCYYLSKFYLIFEEVESKEVIKNISFYNEDYSIIRNKGYEAVIAKPGGYWTNDLPVPMVLKDKRLLTPIYGGEQFGSELYSQNSVPLPWGLVLSRKKGFKLFFKDLIKRILNKKIDNNFFFREQLDFKLIEHKLVGDSKSIYFERQYDFNENKITMIDKIQFKEEIRFDKFIPVNFFLFSNQNVVKIHVEEYELSIENEHYCSLGQLNCHFVLLKDITFKKGEYIKVTSELKFEDNQQ